MKLVNCDIYKFIDIVKDKCLVCFGAGLALSKFVDRYAALSLEKYIDYIADNDETKAGMRRKLIQKEVPIIHADEIKRLSNVVVLITCADVYNVFTQLNSYLELDQAMCFSTGFVISDTNVTDDVTRYYPDSFRITSQPMIPKKIHYCWFGGNPIPEKNLKWMESWKKYCPDYEIICWDESNYDIAKNQYMYEAYQAKMWGFVPDYARLDIIYQHGGIYLDTDVELIADLDELLYQYSFAGIDRSWLVSLGLGFGAVQQCDIIRELRDIYDDLRFYDKNSGINMLIAPEIQKNFFLKKGYINNGEYQIIDNMTIYPEKVLSVKCNYTGRILPTSRSKAIHHYDGSWNVNEKKERVLNVHKLFQEECVEL